MFLKRCLFLNKCYLRTYVMLFETKYKYQYKDKTKATDDVKHIGTEPSVVCPPPQATDNYKTF